MYPTLINQVGLMLKYWFHVSQAGNNTLVSKCYKECQELARAGKPCWLTGVEKVLFHYNMGSLWERVLTSPNSFKTRPNMNKIRTLMEDDYSKLWLDKINKTTDGSLNGNKLRTYASFKNTFNIENYLLVTDCKQKRSSFTRLRISAHNLMIEKGRHKRPKLEVKDRTCIYCKNSEIEDEKHFMLQCKLYNDRRIIMFDSITEILPIFKDLSRSEQFQILMSGFLGDSEIIKIVVSYVQGCTEIRAANEICTGMQGDNRYQRGSRNT
jgi:hypothetical protein